MMFGYLLTMKLWKLILLLRKAFWMDISLSEKISVQCLRWKHSSTRGLVECLPEVSVHARGGTSRDLKADILRGTDVVLARCGYDTEKKKETERLENALGIQIRRIGLD